MDQTTSPAELDALARALCEALERSGGAETAERALRLAAQFIEVAAYDLAGEAPGDEVSALILKAAELERRADALGAARCPTSLSAHLRT